MMRASKRSKLLAKPQPAMMCAADFLKDEAEHVVAYKSQLIDFNHTLVVVELDYGVVVETMFTGDNETTLVETLFSTDRKLFTVIGRWRVGPEHSEWKSYPRDSFYPLRGQVRL
jgi:hypothetical protein